MSKMNRNLECKTTMKRLSILLAAIFLVAGVASAQSRSSYFMEGSYLRTNMNPALAPSRSYVVIPVLGGAGLNISSNYLSADNLFYQKDGEFVTALHNSVSAEEFSKKMPKNMRLSMNADIALLGVGFYTKDIFWTAGVNGHFMADSNVPSSLVKTLKVMGNGSTNIDSMALDVTAYADLYVGASVPVCDWLMVGAKLKFLVGLANAGLQFDELSVNISADSVDGELNGTWRAAGADCDNRLINSDSKFEDLVGNGGKLHFNNFGLAVDLGAEARLLDDRLKLSAAITDLGFIKWSKVSHIGGELKGDFFYRGVNFDSGEVDSGSNFNDSLIGLDEYTGYTTRLQCALNIGAEYNILDNRIGFGLLSHTKFCNTMTYSELTASVNFRPLSWLSATVSHTIFNRNPAGIFGLALNVHTQGFNLFVGADFLGRYVKITEDPDTFIPRRMKSVNLHAGIAINFGKVKRNAFSTPKKKGA